MRRNFWLIAGAVALFISVLGWAEERMVITTTESVKYRVLFLAGGEVGKGDYVNVSVSHPYIDPKGPALLTKRVACVEGDTLTFDGAQHFCNGEALGSVLAKTSRGEVLTPFVWNGPVPEGAVFLAGEHPRSFDSRYFGFKPHAELTKVWPLF